MFLTTPWAVYAVSHTPVGLAARAGAGPTEPGGCFVWSILTASTARQHGGNWRTGGRTSIQETHTHLQQHEDEVRRVPHPSPRRWRHVAGPQDAHREPPRSGLHAHLLGHPLALAVAIAQLLPLVRHVCGFHECLRLCIGGWQKRRFVIKVVISISP